MLVRRPPPLCRFRTTMPWTEQTEVESTHRCSPVHSCLKFSVVLQNECMSLSTCRRLRAHRNSLRHDIVEQLHLYASCWRFAYRDVEEDYRADMSCWRLWYTRRHIVRHSSCPTSQQKYMKQLKTYGNLALTDFGGGGALRKPVCRHV